MFPLKNHQQTSEFPVASTFTPSPVARLNTWTSTHADENIITGGLFQMNLKNIQEIYKKWHKKCITCICIYTNPILHDFLWLSRCEPDFQVLFGDQWHLGGSGELTAGSWKKTYKNQKLAIFFGVSRLRYVLCFFFWGNQLIEIWWSWIYIYIYYDCHIDS